MTFLWTEAAEFTDTLVLSVASTMFFHTLEMHHLTPPPFATTTIQLHIQVVKYKVLSVLFPVQKIVSWRCFSVCKCRLVMVYKYHWPRGRRRTVACHSLRLRDSHKRLIRKPQNSKPLSQFPSPSLYKHTLISWKDKQACFEEGIKKAGVSHPSSPVMVGLTFTVQLTLRCSQSFLRSLTTRLFLRVAHWSTLLWTNGEKKQERKQPQVKSRVPRPHFQQ